MIWIGLICHHPPSTTLHHHHLPRSPTHSQLLSFPFLSLHTYSLPYSRQSEYAIRFIVHGPLSTLPSPLSHVHSPFIHSFIHSTPIIRIPAFNRTATAHTCMHAHPVVGNLINGSMGVGLASALGCHAFMCTCFVCVEKVKWRIQGEADGGGRGDPAYASTYMPATHVATLVLTGMESWEPWYSVHVCVLCTPTMRSAYVCVYIYIFSVCMCIYLCIQRMYVYISMYSAYVCTCMYICTYVSTWSVMFESNWLAFLAFP